MKILNFNKININNIILNKVKTKDDLKIIEVKYKNNETGKKDPCIFKVSNMNTISNILYNNIRQYYIELLINNIDFYNFILLLEEHIKNLILNKSDKILNNIEDVNEYTIEELFKSNIKLSKDYTNPIIKVNIIRNVRNKNANTLIYDRNKKVIDDEKVNSNQDISLIINLDKIIITNYTIEIILQVEQIKINKYEINEIIKRNLNEYNFDTDEEEEEEEEDKQENTNEENNNEENNNKENNNEENIDEKEKIVENKNEDNIENKNEDNIENNNLSE
tara:strand:+ start:664 stop:1494 length:831 start_codon:yes stop_codon:yes gene_type:complete